MIPPDEKALLLRITGGFVPQTVKRLPTVWVTWVRSLDQEDPLEKEMATDSSILAWKIHGWRSLVGYSPWRSQRVGHD